MGSFIQVGKYFNSNILYTCEAFCLWLYFFQSKLQFRNKFCTLAKNPLSPPETNSSFFSFSITFGEIYKAIKFSPAVFFLVITFLFFFNPSNIYSQLLYARWVPGSKETKMQSNTEPSFYPPRSSAQSLIKHLAICQRPLRPPLCTSLTPTGKATQVPHHPLQLIHYCDPTPLLWCPWDSRANIPFASSVLPFTLVFTVVKHI